MKRPPKTKLLFRLILPVLLVILIFAPALIAQADTEDCGKLLPLFCPTDINFDIPTPSGDDAKSILENLVYGIAQNVREVIAALAIAFLVLSGFFLVTAQGEEEQVTKQKKNILWALIGLAILSMSGAIMEIFKFACPDGVCESYFTDANTLRERVHKFDLQVQIIVTFIRYIIGSIAILYIVRSALKMIVAGYKEEVTTEEKKTIWAILIGLLIIGISDFFVRKVLYKVRPYPSTIEDDIVVNPEKGIEQIIGITNFIVTFAGPVAVLMLVVGAILYLMSGGDETRMNRAKELIMYTLVGIIVIYSAYGIVATFISGTF